MRNKIGRRKRRVPSKRYKKAGRGRRVKKMKIGGPNGAEEPRVGSTVEARRRRIRWINWEERRIARLKR